MGGQAMKLGLYMATQWRQGADLGPELLNLIEQTRVAKASGLASLMVGQHFVSSPLQMFQAMPLLARLAVEADARLADRRQCRHRAGAGLSSGGVRLDRRAVQGARAALRGGRRGHPQAV